MESLNEDGTITESSNGNVYVDASGTVDKTIYGSLHVERDAETVQINDDVIGSVHIKGGADVEIDGNIRGDVHIKGTSRLTVRGEISGTVFDRSDTTVIEK